MVQSSSSSTSRYSSSSSPLSLHLPSSSSSASTSDRYLGYSPSLRHDRSQHYLPSNNTLDDIAAFSTESPQDAPSLSSSSIHARHFRGYSAPELGRERYRYDSDGKLLEQNQTSSPTASPSSSPTQQQQQQQQPHPRAPQHQQQHHQHQFHPYHHQQHQPHNGIHHYPQYSQPSSSMHESSSSSIGNQQHRVIGLPMGSHLLPTVGFNSINPPKKDDNDRRSSPVVAQAAVNNNNGRTSMQAHALPPSTSPWERGEHEHEHEREQQASSEVINGNYNSDGSDDPHYRYPIHSHTYPPSISNSNRNNPLPLPLPLPLQPSSSSSSFPPSSASSPSSSLSVSPSSSSPLSSPSSSPTSAAARLASNHPFSETTSAPFPLLTSTSTAGALPLSTATVPWNRSSLRHEIISMESPPPPTSSASFHSLNSSSSSRHSNPSHGHTHSHTSSSTTPSPPHSVTHSPTTTAMKTPPHPTPDSSSSPETQKRKNRPTIPTTSTTTSLPPPPAESPSTPVVSSSLNPSSKVREEEDEDDLPETDTRSTVDSGQQKRRGSALRMTEEEDQEVPRAAAAGAMVGRERGGKGGEQSSIMRAQRATHHANQAAAAGGDENDYDRDRDDDRAAGSPVSPSLLSSSSSFLLSPHTTTSSSHGRINNNNNNNNNNNSSSSNYINNYYNSDNINTNNSSIQQQEQRRIRPDQSFHDSPPPPPVSPSSKRDLPPQHSSSYPQQQQQQSIDSSSQEYHHQQKKMMGKASGPSLYSSSASSPPPPPAHLSSSAVTPDHPSLSSSSSQPLSSSFSLPTGTQQGAASPAHGRFSPSMNHAPLSFDQTGHTPNYPPVHSPSGPSLNNKRRSLADLLFVPTKIKTKRSSSSSVSSVDSSYRQDETGQDLSGNVNAGWSNHPKSASATSTTSTSSTGSMSGSVGSTITSSSNVPHHHYQQQQQQQQQRMSLESQASPPARKSSTVKGIGKSAGGGGVGSSSSPKTFQCTGYPGCNMVFTRSEHLARHERKHTGEKPYKCIVANCPRTFSRYDNMIQHTQTHSDRTKRDSLAAVAAAASAAGVGSGPHSRSSSVQSTPLLPGRPRGGSSPVVFGPSWDEHHRRTQNNSPAATPYNASPAFSHHYHQQQQPHHHPYSPYSPHYQHHQQQQQSHHPIQLSLPSGAPAGSSPTLSTQYYSHHHGAESHPYLPGHQSPSTPVVRTLKANSRSLPHLQARASPMASTSSTTDSPSVGLHQSMSTMEIEELKRRKSEVLLPSSFSGARAASSTSTGYDQGIGLGVAPFIPTTSHPQSLPQVEKLTAGEQERLNEHRRSAQAMFFKMNAGREGFMDTRRTPEYSERSSSTGGPSQQQHHHQHLGVNTTPRSGSTGPVLPQVQQLSALEKDRLLEHRKSTPELLYDAKMKRSSNDPTDMFIQPLPSRDARSGMQWFSQINTPVTSSPRSSLMPRESGGGCGPPSVQGPGHNSSSSSSGPSSGDSSMILPPILGPYEEPQHDRQGRLRSHSSHIHPLSRPSTQLEPSSLVQLSSSAESKDQRQQFDAALSPHLERHWEEQYFPIRKRHAVETIEQMDSREFLGLKYQVAELYANEQSRNPEFLGNMTAILCVVRAPHTAWKGGERRQGSQGSIASASEQGTSFAGSRRTSRDMEVDGTEQRSMAAAATTKATVIKTEDGASAVKKEPMSESMDVDDGSGEGQSITTSKDAVVQPCRFALDIDVDSFSRDPEPDVRGFESLTINSLFPTRSFVAGFEDTPAESHTNVSEKECYLSTNNGYPSNARLGRFYLPERSYRTLESLATQPNPNDRWVCCRFEEYHGVSIWVLESVLDKYHEISRRHKMALTLVGATVHHREAVYSREDWEIHAGEQYEVKAKESVLYPEMIHQVWRDMYNQHHQRAQYQHHQQRAPPIPQVATYEEYQRSLMQSDPRRDSYQPQQQQAPPRDRTGPYYSYSDYRQQQQNLHREDLSSAPSSPQSPRHDDFPDECPQQHQQYQQHQRHGSSASASANMHRRISIAELCNPMQSLATERAQRREDTASKRTSM